MKRQKFSHEVLIKTVVHDANDGLFYDKYLTEIGCKPKPLGGVVPQGYRKIGLFGLYFSEHRLAWFYHYGEWPKNYIDHINGLKADNRIGNLRDVTKKQNGENRHSLSGKSGVRGVCWASKQGAWKAYVRHDSKLYQFGFFKEKSDAEAAAKAARDKFFTHHTA